MLGAGRGGEVADYLARDRGVQHGLAPVHAADRVDQLAAADVLQHVAHRARFDQALHVLVVVVRGKREHGRAREVGGDPRGRLDAVHLRHLDVHQHDIGVGLLDLPKRLHTVRGDADDQEPVLELQELPGALPDQRVVIHDQDADRGGV